MDTPRTPTLGSDAAEPTGTTRLPPSALPTLQRAFSRNAGFWSAFTRALVTAGLLLVAFSTISSAFHAQSPTLPLATYQVKVATIIAAILFLCAGGIRLIRIYNKPENIWFNNRILAERVRSLTWSYAVAGPPLPLTGVAPDKTDANFQKALDIAAAEATASGIRYPNPQPKAPIRVITEWMRQTRALDVAGRRKVYAHFRIQNQEDYYVRHAASTARAARAAQWILLAIEIVGAALATLNAFSIIQLDLVGVAGTVAAGVAAWVQFNQFSELASTYGSMSYRMAAFRERCADEQQPWSEEFWCAFVGEVEGVLREEQGSWQKIVQEATTGDQ